MEQEGTFPFQTGDDGFLHVHCMRIPEQEGTTSFQADVGKPLNNNNASRRSPGFCETADWPATARDSIDRAKQVV